MDAASTKLFDLARCHTEAALTDLDICTLKVYILAKSLTILGAPCRLVSRALYSQKDWGTGFQISTLIAALEFPGGDIIGYLGVKGWPALQAKAEKDTIENAEPISEGSLWDLVPHNQMVAIVSKELKNIGEQEITKICDRIVACVRSDLLRTETNPIQSTTAHSLARRI